MDEEEMWRLNDLKVERLAEKIRKLRIEFQQNNPDATLDRVDAFIKSQLKEESDTILKEQMEIFSHSLLR